MLVSPSRKHKRAGNGTSSAGAAFRRRAFGSGGGGPAQQQQHQLLGVGPGGAGLVRWRSVAVQHCSDAYGLVLEHEAGWKIVYSGECVRRLRLSSHSSLPWPLCEICAWERWQQLGASAGGRAAVRARLLSVCRGHAAVPGAGAGGRRRHAAHPRGDL